MWLAPVRAPDRAILSRVDEPCQNKTRRRLGLAAGLTQFGVNLLELGPGAWSSQRHWHAHEDEFVYVVRGPVVLVTDAGETILGTGDCAAFKAGERDGHHLQNHGEATALILEVGTRGPAEPHAEYPDIDLRVTAQGYVRKDGTPQTIYFAKIMFWNADPAGHPDWNMSSPPG
jgi:uncharacterized cupin superfamily protein